MGPDDGTVFDVAIAGGGIVGCILATALARAGARVAVIEARSPPAAAPAPLDDRPIALSAASVRILETLGIWAQLAPAATPIRRIHVSDRGFPGFARLEAAELGVEAMGHVVPAWRIASAAARVLDSIAGVEVVRPGRVEAIATDGVLARLGVVSAEARRTVLARVAVAADGSESPVARMLGLRARNVEYGQCALVSVVSSTRAHDGTAYERFTRDGPLALLPMSSHRSGLVWTCRPERAEALAAMDEATFLASLQRTFGARLGGFVETGERVVHALRGVRMREQVARRAVVAGNAAHTLHPVAGQGLNLAIRDVAALAEALSGALRDGLDPGSDAVLRAYAAARRGDQDLVQLATDGLVGLFSNRFPGLGVLRAVGLVAFDVLSPVKRAFGRHAMGLGPPQTRLARGLQP